MRAAPEARADHAAWLGCVRPCIPTAGSARLTDRPTGRASMRRSGARGVPRTAADVAG